MILPLIPPGYNPGDFFGSFDWIIHDVIVTYSFYSLPEEGGDENEDAMSTPTLILPHQGGGYDSVIFIARGWRICHDRLLRK